MPAGLDALIKKGVLTVPGVYSAAVAMLAQDAGFKALYISGAGLSNSNGLPDAGVLTRDEVKNLSSYIIRAVKIPAIIDADTGFGGPGEAAKTVSEFESIGACAIQLEDQEFPKRCGHLPGKRVIAAKDFAEKIRSAAAARRRLLIIARTDARAVTGLHDAIERARLYIKAGADMIFPEALESKSEFLTFAQAVKGQAPLMANMTEFGKSPYLTVREFDDMGYSLVIFPMTCFRASMRACADTLAALKEKGTQKGLLKNMMTRQEINRLLKYKV